MSKSLGNFFTLREIFEKFPPRVVRYFLLSQHYRSPLDFSDDKLEQAANALAGIDEAYQKLALVPMRDTLPRPLDDLEPNALPEVLADFSEALDDDFNTEKALAVVHTLRREATSPLAPRDPDYARKASQTLRSMLEDYLGIPLLQEHVAPLKISALKAAREQARKEKNWAKADAFRKQLNSAGYKVEDNPDGTSTLIRTKGS